MSLPFDAHRPSVPIPRHLHRGSMPTSPSPAPRPAVPAVPHAWGTRRLLRFLTANDAAAAAAAAWGSSPRRPRDDEDELAPDDDGGIEAVRAKLMVHLREAAERVKLTVSSGLEREPAVAKTEPAAAAEATEHASSSAPAGDAARPWNLRSRAAVRKVSRYGFDPDDAPAPVAAAAADAPARPARQRHLDVAARRSERQRRPAFSVSLSSQEIAEDIYALTGALPRRRPRKRPRTVQRRLDDLVPGSWLAEITTETYKVSD